MEEGQTIKTGLTLTPGSTVWQPGLFQSDTVLDSELKSITQSTMN